MSANTGSVSGKGSSSNKTTDTYSFYEIWTIFEALSEAYGYSAFLRGSYREADRSAMDTFYLYHYAGLVDKSFVVRYIFDYVNDRVYFNQPESVNTAYNNWLKTKPKPSEEALPANEAPPAVEEPIAEPKKDVIYTYYFDADGFVSPPGASSVDRSIFKHSFDWKLSDEIFLNTKAITKERFIEKCQAKNSKLTKSNLTEIFDTAINFKHSELFAEGVKSPFTGPEVKKLINGWINGLDDYKHLKNAGKFADRKGINPLVLVAAMKWESNFGKDSENYFGDLGYKSDWSNTTKATLATRKYLQPFYLGLFCVYNPDDFAAGPSQINYPRINMDAHDTQKRGTFPMDACNPAIYSLMKYTTDTIFELKSNDLKTS